MTIFHRGQTEADLPANVHHVHGDFSALPDHLGGLRDFWPEVVLDMVPFRREEGRRVRAFKGVARRVVVLSSADVYRAFGRIHRTEPGPPDPVPLTEDSPLREKPVAPPGSDPLAYDKTGVEREATGDPDLPVTILRLPATHGPGDSAHRLFRYLKRMDDDRPAILLDAAYARWRWVRGYVEDVALAIALAVTDERAAGRVYNVADPVAYTEAEWVRRIAHGWNGAVIAGPAEQLPESMRSEIDTRQDYAVDSGRIRRELSYTEVVAPFEALRRTIEWERAHPPEQIQPERFDYAAEDEVLARLRAPCP